MSGKVGGDVPSGSALPDVSRETLEKLRALEALLLTWTSRINLIAPESRTDIWNRHILDSLQIARLATPGQSWLDLGSGGGFPGLVVAICLQEHHPQTSVQLVESDQRKCVFLKRAVQSLDLNAVIHHARIEHLPQQQASIISARALAPLDALLGFVARHLHPSGTALLMKGRNWQNELSFAAGKWSFLHEAIASQTDENAVILRVQDVKKRGLERG